MQSLHPMPQICSQSITGGGESLPQNINNRAPSFSIYSVSNLGRGGYHNDREHNRACKFSLFKVTGVPIVCVDCF